jgi:hypothetical protein
MIYSDYTYIDLAIGSVANRNNVQDITKIKNYSGQFECYRTVFRFNNSYKMHFDNTKSVSGFRGNCYADWLPIDIDSQDLNEAYGKTKTVIEMLKLDFDYDAYYLFFSGAKGFHILIPSQCFGIFQPSEKLPNIFKLIAKDLCQDNGDGTIYEINRLFRMVNSQHGKSNLFKIPLTRMEFNLGIDKIKELAKQPKESSFYSMSDSVINDQFKELYQKYLKTNNVKSEIPQEDKKENKILSILSGVKEGQRDSSATSLAGLFKSKGFDESFTLELLLLLNSQNKPPIEATQLKKVVDSIFKYKEDDLKNIIPAWSLYDEYKEYVTSSKQVNIGIPIIDETIRGIRPGQVMTIMGFTGNYKSAVLQDILRHYSYQSKEPSLLFQLEMSRLDMFERAVQMEMHISGSDVETMFKQNDELDKQNVLELLKHQLEHVYFIDKSGLSFSDIEKYTRLAEEKVYRKKTGLIGIDFVQLMNAKGATEIQIVSEVAKEAKQFAKNMNVPVILVSQISNVLDAETEVKLMDARYSKTISIMGDFVLGIWIEKIPNSDNIKQIISVLKNRKGKLITIEREINAKCLKFEVESIFKKIEKQSNQLPFTKNKKGVSNVKDITTSKKDETSPF